VIAVAATLFAPAISKPQLSSRPVSPAVDAAVKMLLEEQAAKPRHELIDPGEEKTLPANFRPTRHRQLDGVLIMGGAEALPM